MKLDHDSAVVKRSRQPSASEGEIFSAARDGGILFSGRIFDYGGRFIFGLILARFLGSEGYGIYGLAATILSVLTFFCLFGFDISIVHQIAVYKNREDNSTLRGTLFISFLIPFLTAAFLGLLVYLFSNVIASFFGESRLRSTLTLVAIALPFSTVLYIGAQSSVGFRIVRYRVVCQDVALNILKLGLIVPFCIVGFNASVAMGTHALAVMICAAMILYFLNRHFALFDSVTISTSSLNQSLAVSIPVYLSGLATLFLVHIQTITLATLSNVADVGVFIVATRICTIGNLFYASLLTVGMAQVAHLYSQKQWNELGFFYQVVTKWTFAFYLPFFLVILFFSDSLLAVFGQEFMRGTNALVILALAGLIRAGTGICGPMLTMTGKPWLNAANSTIAVVAALSCSMVLIPRLGLLGAAFGELVGSFVLNALQVFQVFFLYRLSPYNASFIKSLAAGAVATVLTYLLNHLVFPAHSVLYVCLSILLLLFFYTIATLIMGLDRHDRLILNRIQSGRKRKQ